MVPWYVMRKGVICGPFAHITTRLMSRTGACSRWIAKSNSLGRWIWLSAASVEDGSALVLNMSQQRIPGLNEFDKS
jgi:hypothetical protein